MRFCTQNATCEMIDVHQTGFLFCMATLLWTMREAMVSSSLHFSSMNESECDATERDDVATSLSTCAPVTCDCEVMWLSYDVLHASTLHCLVFAWRRWNRCPWALKKKLLIWMAAASMIFLMAGPVPSRGEAAKERTQYINSTTLGSSVMREYDE